MTTSAEAEAILKGVSMNWHGYIFFGALFIAWIFSFMVATGLI